MISIILAEDHNIVRNGLRSLLEKDGLFEIAGEATNGKEVLGLIAGGVKPDIIMADMNMPEMGGLELAEQISQTNPECKVIILSAHDHEKYVMKAFRLGVSGYLLKSVNSDELIFAIKHVFNNNHYICSELTSKFLYRLLTVPEHFSTQQIHDIEFTDKEVEILGYLSEGYTNQEIADRIFLSKRTIESQRQNLIDKTSSRNTAALIRFALVNGVIN